MGHDDRSSPRRVIVLGATGSIGRQSLEVIAHLNAARARAGEAPMFRVVGLAAGRDQQALLAAARAHSGARLALASSDMQAAGLCTGPEAAEQLVREVEADLVIGAMVGFAGLPAMLAAVELGRDVALANKEALVAAGELVVRLAREHGACLLPVDSEHSGIWQAIGAHAAGAWDRAAPPIDVANEITRVTLTASGGALRNMSPKARYHATPAQALAHPTWNMGAKVTIDTASLTNKALELVEAAWLFGLRADQLDVLIHPQSIVHALIEYADRSVVAQLGTPDMRTPIQTALTWPARHPGLAPVLDLTSLARLDFEAPDFDQFPALGAGFEIIRRGGACGAIFSAANEVAVHAFLDQAIPFGRIAEISCAAIDEVGSSAIRSIADILEADAEGRRFARSRLGASTTSTSTTHAVRS